MLCFNLCLPFNSLLPLGGHQSSIGEQSIQGVQSSGTKILQSFSPQTYAFEKGALLLVVGQAPARLEPTALAWDRQCGNLFSPKEFSSITKSLIQYVNKVSY